MPLDSQRIGGANVWIGSKHLAPPCHQMRQGPGAASEGQNGRTTSLRVPTLRTGTLVVGNAMHSWQVLKI